MEKNNVAKTKLSDLYKHNTKELEYGTLLTNNLFVLSWYCLYNKSKLSIKKWLNLRENTNNKSLNFNLYKILSQVEQETIRF